MIVGVFVLQLKDLIEPCLNGLLLIERHETNEQISYHGLSLIFQYVIKCSSSQTTIL